MDWLYWEKIYIMVTLGETPLPPNNRTNKRLMKQNYTVTLSELVEGSVSRKNLF